MTEGKDCRALVSGAERTHGQVMAQLCAGIARRYAAGGARVVAVSGPSSSGKTTFASRMCGVLRTAGLNPVQLSIDDYFVDREVTPRDADGNYDFEALECVDLALLNSQLESLLAGESITVPLYDFCSGHRQWHDEPLRLADRSVIVMEGIHALNPALTPSLPRECICGIFVSVESDHALPDGSCLKPEDVRLLRRISRDYAHRGHSAAATIAMWPSVRRGEERNIVPYRCNADMHFDSGLDYETGVLRTVAEPLLAAIEPGSAAACEAERLLSLLRHAEPLPVECVPCESLLSEFVR